MIENEIVSSVLDESINKSSTEEIEPKNEIIIKIEQKILTKVEQKELDKKQKAEQKELDKKLKVEKKELDRKLKTEKRELDRKLKAEQKELDKILKVEHKLLDKEKERNVIIANSLVDNIDTVNLDGSLLELNKRYKPFFKVCYRISKGLSNITYNKHIKASVAYVENAIISLLKLSQVDYKKSVKIQDCPSKNISEYETEEVFIRTIIVKNYSIIPNMIRNRINNLNFVDKNLNIQFDTDIYDKGYDISSSVVFDKINNTYISIELEGNEESINLDSKNYFDIGNMVKEVADKVEIVNEYYDRQMINYIYHNLDYISNILYEEKKQREKVHISYDEYKKVLETKINQLLNSIADINYKKNCRQIIFKPREDNFKGRKYAVQKSSYQNLPRTIRHLIGQKYYTDIDMVNAHFNICKYLINSKSYLNKSDYSNILRYADNRQEFYDAIKEKYEDESDDKIKRLFISVLFNEDYKADNHKYKSIRVFNEFVEEIKLLQQNLYKSQEYSHHILVVEKIIENEDTIAKKKKEVYDKDNQNIIGKVLSRILQEIENDILECIIEYLKLNKIVYSSLQYDGLQLLKPEKYNELGFSVKPDFNLDNGLLYRVEEYVKHKINIEMPLSFKSLESKIKIPSSYINSYEREYLVSNNETDVENLFIDINKHILNIEKNTKAKFIKHDNVWVYTPIEFQQRVKLLLKNLNIFSLNYETDPDNKKLIDEYLSGDICVDRYKDIFTKLQSFKLNRFNSKLDTIAKMVNESCSYGTDNFDDCINNSTIGNISFNNGVYFLKTKEFKPYPVEEVYSTIKLDINYPTQTDETKTDGKFIIERFEDGFFEENKYLVGLKLKATARMIGGHFRDKFWLNGVSYGRNSCKGVETAVQQKAFGKYYNPIANSFFLVKPTGDEVKDNSTLIPMRFCRILTTQEPTNGKKTDGALIKSYASGGDPKTARYFYSDIMISFVPHFIINLYCNKGLTMDNSDAYDNCFYVYYDICYEDNVIDTKRQKPKITFEGKDIKDLLLEDRYIRAYWRLIIDSYEDKPFSIDKRIKERIAIQNAIAGVQTGFDIASNYFEWVDDDRYRISWKFFVWLKDCSSYKSELKDIKYLHHTDFMGGINQISPSKDSMKGCLDVKDTSKNIGKGFPKIKCKNDDSLKLLIEYMLNEDFSKDNIRERFSGLYKITDDMF